MNLVDYLIIAVVVAIVGGAAFYIWKAKKNGKKCIGCPHAAACAQKCSGCSGCSTNQK